MINTYFTDRNFYWSIPQKANSQNCCIPLCPISLNKQQYYSISS